MSVVLFVHIIAACAWVGGSILLFGLGVFLKGEERQKSVYAAIGPFYGYFETVWLVLLLSSGAVLLYNYELFGLVGRIDTELARVVTVKLMLVSILTIATIIHLIVALKTHNKARTKKQMIISRAGSLAIFVLNFAVIWYAILLRTYIY
jgi:putative copper export protein